MNIPVALHHLVQGAVDDESIEADPYGRDYMDFSDVDVAKIEAAARKAQWCLEEYFSNDSDLLRVLHGHALKQQVVKEMLKSLKEKMDRIIYSIFDQLWQRTSMTPRSEGDELINGLYKSYLSFQQIDQALSILEQRGCSSEDRYRVAMCRYQTMFRIRVHLCGGY